MPRVRHHVNPLQAEFLEIAVPRISPSEGSYLDVEIGSAGAEFLMDLGAAWPEGRFVGLEIRKELVKYTNQCCAQARLPVLNVFANVSKDLPRLFAPATVRRFYVNFPDPWWKSRQQKRRVLNEDLVADMHQALRPGGEIFVETDIFDLALDGMAALEGAEHQGARAFENTRSSWSFLPDNPFPGRSRRERWCDEHDIKIWRVLYRKLT